MFLWRMEELKLFAEDKLRSGEKSIFPCETTIKREDKIAFVDNFHDNKLSYLLVLLNDYSSQKNILAHDKYGCVWTGSLKKWLKEHDARGLVDRTLWHGAYELVSCRRFLQLELPGPGDIYADFVDEVFHRQLLLCLEKEKNYFYEHDPFTIMKKELKVLYYDCVKAISFPLIISENDNVYIPILNSIKLDITYPEGVELIEKYKALKFYIKTLCHK